jgi:hypothetical protein
MHSLHEYRDGEPGGSRPATRAAAEASGLIRKRDVALAASVSCRSVENWMRAKRIPFLRLSRRCVRFSWPAVRRALERFEIKERGR